MKKNKKMKEEAEEKKKKFLTKFFQPQLSCWPAKTVPIPKFLKLMADGKDH
jgi:hypothetical protein